MKHIASAICWLGLLAAIVYLTLEAEAPSFDLDLWDVGMWIVVVPSAFVVSMGLAFAILAAMVFAGMKIVDWIGL